MMMTVHPSLVKMAARVLILLTPIHVRVKMVSQVCSAKQVSKLKPKVFHLCQKLRSQILATKYYIPRSNMFCIHIRLGADHVLC